MVRILLVDDEEVERITLAEILRLEGYEVDTVNSGEMAIEMLRRESFDVMILDLKMGGISGMDVLGHVVNDQMDISVIILTAYGSMDSAIQAIRYQVHDYLMKPVPASQVIKSIERAILKKKLSEREVDKQRVSRSHVEYLPGGVILTWEKRQISWASGNLSLTPTEAKLLNILFDRRNELVTHSELVYLIQGYRIETEEAAKILRPVVSRLRHKLTVVPEWGDKIKNVRGAGYVLELD